MNTRYMAYCRVNGNKTPEEMMAIDAEKFPGGVMCGYILWINEQWAEWDHRTERPAGQPRNLRDHYDFDTWLDKDTARI